jgi:hypothetical protein
MPKTKASYYVVTSYPDKQVRLFDSDQDAKAFKKTVRAGIIVPCKTKFEAQNVFSNLMKQQGRSMTMNDILKIGLMKMDRVQKPKSENSTPKEWVNIYQSVWIESVDHSHVFRWKTTCPHIQNLSCTKSIDSKKWNMSKAGLLAILDMLQSLDANNQHNYAIHTTHKFVYDCITKNAQEWKERNWYTKNGKPIKNQSLIKQIMSLVDQHKQEWTFELEEILSKKTSSL